MPPKQRLELLIAGKMRLALNDCLRGDWSQVQAARALSRDVFDEWADSVELPYGGVFQKWGEEDGVYVLQDAEGWLVIKQCNGIPLPGRRVYATYKEAKRAALACEFQEILRASGK